MLKCWRQHAQQDRQRLCGRLHAIALTGCNQYTHSKQSHHMHTRSYFDWLELHKLANSHFTFTCTVCNKTTSKGDEQKVNVSLELNIVDLPFLAQVQVCCSGISNGCLRYLEVWRCLLWLQCQKDYTAKLKLLDTSITHLCFFEKFIIRIISGIYT